MDRSLSRCTLFEGVQQREIEDLLDRYSYQERSFAKGDVVLIKGTRLDALSILTQGSLSAETTDVLGQMVSVEHITSPAVIAPTYLFAKDNSLPVSFSARTVVRIGTIQRSSFCDMIRSEQQILENFMALLSASNRFVSDKVLFLTYRTIKAKYASYLLNIAETVQSLKFRNDLTQAEMASMFGVTRPALARAIGELVDDGAIYVNGKGITILFPEKLKQYTK